MTLYPLYKRLNLNLLPYKHINSSILSKFNYETLYELQRYSCLKYNNNILFEEKNIKTNNWNKITYNDFSKNINKYKTFLINNKITYGDIIGCISNNNSDVATLMYACYSIGAIFVGMYNNQSFKDWEFIINDSSVKTLFVSNDVLYKNLDKNKIFHKVNNVYILNNQDQSLNNVSIKHIIKKNYNSVNKSFIPNKNDIANIIYTSGTSNPILKGVELTHNNFISNIKGVHKLLDNDLIKSSDKSLSYVPWSHSYGLTELNGMISYGGSIAICNDVHKLNEDLIEVKPNILFSVPILLTKIKDNINNKLDNSNNIIKYLSNISFNYKGNKDSIHYKFLDYILLSKIRDKLGGNIKTIFSAGSAIDLETIKFYNDLGINVYQGYGLSETSPIISLCTKKNYLSGSVGKVLHNLDVKIVSNNNDILENNKIGEVCVSGPSVFKKYCNNFDSNISFIDLIIKSPDINLKKNFTINKRYFKTGDLGYIDDENNLFITGRIKETFKLDNGKFIVPSIIENELNKSKYIKNIILYGLNKPYLIALIEMNDEYIKINTINEIQDIIKTEFKNNLRNFKKYEIPKKFLIIDEPFTIENGCLTSKLSLKKHFIFKKYSKAIEFLYKEK